MVASTKPNPMYKQKSVLALIPARGGSKRLAGTNLKLIAGVPLIAHSIRAAWASRHTDRVVVSTDDAMIAAAARVHGAEVPFLRPAGLASDAARSEDVVRHALAVLGPFDFVALLQPTSPLRSGGIIDRCIEKCIERGAPACVTVYPVRHGGKKLLEVEEGSDIVTRVPALEHCARRPPGAFVLAQENGAVYVLDAAAFLASDRIFSEGTIALEMSEWQSVDIDYEEDFAAAEALLRNAS